MGSIYRATKPDPDGRHPMPVQQRGNDSFELLENPASAVRRTTATRTSWAIRPRRSHTPTCSFVPPISTPRYMS